MLNALKECVDVLESLGFSRDDGTQGAGALRRADKSMEMQGGLLPCPFCGGFPKVVSCSLTYAVMCNVCGIEFEGATAEGSILLWNGRF